MKNILEKIGLGIYPKLGILGYAILAYWTFLFIKMVIRFVSTIKNKSDEEYIPTITFIVVTVFLILFSVIGTDILNKKNDYYEFTTTDGQTYKGTECYTSGSMIQSGELRCKADDGTVYTNIKSYKYIEVEDE